MPIITFDLDDHRTAFLDALANDQRRSRRSQLAVILEAALDKLADEARDLPYPENGPEHGEE